MRRKSISNSTTLQVLTESGYRCAVPTCRTILAIDVHHLVEISEGGGNELGNLLALCPTCHALFHRGTIQRDSMYAWKLILVSLGRAFDTTSVDDLLFLSMPETAHLYVSGDGVLKFSRLIATGLAGFKRIINPSVLYSVSLTPKGTELIDAWKNGDRQAVAAALGENKNPE